MKKFTIMLLSVISVISVVGSVQIVAADHLEQGIGIFKNDGNANIVESHDSKWQIYLQIMVRNEDGQLISVTENTKSGAYIPHPISDHVFDTLMGEKEIVTIDKVKYEKAQYVSNPTREQRWIGLYPIFSEITMKFKLEGDALAKMNETIKDHSIWKIHYCATFKGHGYECIPIFQVLVPNMTTGPHDTIHQQWTFLREMN